MGHKIRRLGKLIILTEFILQVIAFSKFVYYKYAYSRGIKDDINKNWFYRQKTNSWWNTESAALIATFHPFHSWIYSNITTPHIHFNKDGVRKTNGNPDNASNTKTIYIFGGSAIAGVAVSDNETVPSRLSQIMNSKYPKYTVENYGQYGFNSSQELSRLIQLLKNGGRPDLVIFYDGYNDVALRWNEPQDSQIYYEQSIKRRLGNIRNLAIIGPPENTSLINPKLFTFITTYIKIIRYPYKGLMSVFGSDDGNKQQVQNHSETQLETSSEKIADEYEKNAAMVEKLSETYDFKYLLLWQPVIYTKNQTSLEMTVKFANLDDRRRLYQKVTDALNKKAIRNFTDLSQIFNDYKNKTIFLDPVHVSPEGNQIIANKIRDLIVALE